MSKNQEKPTRTVSKQIQEFRTRIDEIDENILTLINER
jgi:chorismate mutase